MNQLERIAQEIATMARSLDCDKIMVITDTNVAPMVEETFGSYPMIATQPGEPNKSLVQAERIWEFFENCGATRRSLAVNVGGGMVTDLGGFAASIFKRGIRYVNVPTTLLAAVDAAIGGKTAVNFHGLKNEIGVFALPHATLPATSLFGSLPHEEWLSGYGEMLKTGLLAGDELYGSMACGLELLRKDSEKLLRLVQDCAGFKEKIVEADLREGGLRKILNLGHTAGHAVEMVALRKRRPVAHGIAVAYGILVALVLSRMLVDASRELLYGFNEVLKENFPKPGITCSDIEELIELMGHDKKNARAGMPAFVLLKQPGEPVIDVVPSRQELESALEIAIETGF